MAIELGFPAVAIGIVVVAATAILAKTYIYDKKTKKSPVDQLKQDLKKTGKKIEKEVDKVVKDVKDKCKD